MDLPSIRSQALGPPMRRPIPPARIAKLTQLASNCSISCLVSAIGLIPAERCLQGGQRFLARHSVHQNVDADFTRAHQIDVDASLG